MTEGPWVSAFRRKQAADFDQWLDDLARQPWGRGFFRHLLDSPEFCGVNGPIPYGDPLKMAYRLGQRDMGLRLMRDLQRVNFDLYIRLLHEQANEASRFLIAEKNDAEHMPLPKEM